jgi:hypothetical protein
MPRSLGSIQASFSPSITFGVFMKPKMHDDAGDASADRHDPDAVLSTRSVGGDQPHTLMQDAIILMPQMMNVQICQRRVPAGH